MQFLDTQKQGMIPTQHIETHHQNNQIVDAIPVLMMPNQQSLNPIEMQYEQIKQYVKILYIVVNIAFVCILIVAFILNQNFLKTSFAVLASTALFVCILDIIVIVKEISLPEIYQKMLILIKQSIILSSLLTYSEQEHDSVDSNQVQEVLFTFIFLGIELSRRIQLISFPYIIYLLIVFIIMQDFCKGAIIYFILSFFFVCFITLLMNKIEMNIHSLIFYKSFGIQSDENTMTSNHKNLSYFMSFQFNCTTSTPNQPYSYILNPSFRKLGSQTQSHYLHSGNNVQASGGLVQLNNKIRQTSSHLNFQNMRYNLNNQNTNKDEFNLININSNKASSNQQQDFNNHLNLNMTSSQNMLMNNNGTSLTNNPVNQNLHQLLSNKNVQLNNYSPYQSISQQRNNLHQRQSSRGLTNNNQQLNKCRSASKTRFSSMVAMGSNGCSNCGGIQYFTVDDSIIQQNNISPNLKKSNTQSKLLKKSTLSKTHLSMINDESFIINAGGNPISFPTNEKTHQNKIQSHITIPFNYLIISSQEKKIELVETNIEDTKRFMNETHIDELTVSLEKFIKMFFDPKYKEISEQHSHICSNTKSSVIYKMIIQDHLQSELNAQFLPSPSNQATPSANAVFNQNENLIQLNQVQQSESSPQNPGFQKRSSYLSLTKNNSIVFNLNQNQNIQSLKHLSKNIAIFYFVEVTDVYKEIQTNINNNNNSDKQGYKDDLLATVTHDLKNPLNGMVQMLDLCEKELVKQKDYTQQNQFNLDKVREFVSVAQKNTQLLLFLVHDIQDFYQHSKRKLRLVSEQVKIEELINELNSLFLSQVKLKGIELSFISKLSNEYIYTDGFRLKQILINLISNAIKYTSKGGVSVTLSPTNKSELFKISIQDTGSGIPDNIKNELFKLYQTFDNKDGENPRGVGLGLVISQKLVQEMGPSKQQIQLISEKGKGTTFSFVIFLNLQDKHIVTYCDANSVVSAKTEGCSIEDDEILANYKAREEAENQDEFTQQSEQEDYYSIHYLENALQQNHMNSHANIPLVSDRIYNINDLKTLGFKTKVKLNPQGQFHNELIQPSIQTRQNTSLNNTAYNIEGIINNLNLNDNYQCGGSSQYISLTPKSIQESERNFKNTLEYKVRTHKSPFRNTQAAFTPHETSPPPEKFTKTSKLISNNSSQSIDIQNNPYLNKYTSTSNNIQKSHQIGISKSIIRHQLNIPPINSIQPFQSEIIHSEYHQNQQKTLLNTISLNENLKLADRFDFDLNQAISYSQNHSQPLSQLQIPPLSKSKTPTQKRLNNNNNNNATNNNNSNVGNSGNCGNFSTTLQNQKKGHKKAIRKLSSSYYINNIPEQNALHSPLIEHSSNEQFINQLRTLGIKKILIVDDEPFNIYVMLQTLDFLSRNDFQLEKVHNGEEAVNQVKSDPRGIQLIFMDANMPVMKGTDAIKAIKTINQDIINIMISGDSRLDEVQNAQQSGADGFLPKPVKLQHIKKEINKIYAQITQSNVLHPQFPSSSYSELMI